MAANLVIDIELPIENQNGKSVTGWENSIVVLLWLNQRRKYKQFVSNRFDKIRKKDFINWYYVLIKEKLEDIDSRGSLISIIPYTWTKGTAWLPNINKWPDQPV